MSKPKPKPPTTKPESASDLATSITVEALTEIQKEIRGVIDGSRSARRGDKTLRIAQLAQKASLVAAEQRKAEKGELEAIRKLSPAVVLTWIRQQTAEYRAKLLREITAIDSKERRSVLG